MGLLIVSIETGCSDHGSEGEDPIVCGNSVCETGETQATCPADCTPVAGQTCGDGVCEGTENTDSCPADCASLSNLDGVWSYCGWSDSSADAAAGCAGVTPEASRTVYGGGLVLSYDDSDARCSQWEIEEVGGVLVQQDCWDGAYDYGHERLFPSISVSGDYLTITYASSDGSEEHEFYVRRPGETMASVMVMCTALDDYTCSSTPTLSTAVEPSLVGSWQACGGTSEPDPTVACASTYTDWVVLDADGTALDISDYGAGDQSCVKIDYASATGADPFLEFQECGADYTELWGYHITVTSSGSTYLTLPSEYVDCDGGGGCSTTVEYDHYVSVADKPCPAGVTVEDLTCD